MSQAFITSRIKAAKALLSPDDGLPVERHRTSGDGKSILDALLPPDGVSLDLETHRLTIYIRPVGF